MKKKKFIILTVITSVSILLAILFSGDSRASIKMQDCEVCHLPPGKTEQGEQMRYMLKSALCVNCHSNTGSNTTTILGPATVPVVSNAQEPDKPLAGGNFFYVKNLGDRKGHNVDGIAMRDEKFKGYPPGYDRFLDPSSIGYNPNKPLTCSGSNGCHGDRNREDGSLAGAHHEDDALIDGSTTAKSYRFLKNTETVKGVLGREDAEWQKNATPKRHNEYSPDINMLCEGCHGYIHRNFGAMKQSPWLRHPVDSPLLKSGGYLRYNPGVEPPKEMSNGERVYSLDAPLARSSFDEGLGDMVRPGNDIVICLSCHFAHAGPYDSGLRWDYDAVVAGEAGRGACFICHTDKAE